MKRNHIFVATENVIVGFKVPKDSRPLAKHPDPDERARFAITAVTQLRQLIGASV